MKTYQIGEITLTQQALIVFVLQVVTAISALVLLRKNTKLAVGMFLILLAFGSYVTYLTNCTIVGKCEKLAWFLVAMNVLSAAIIIPMRLKMLKNNK